MIFLPRGIPVKENVDPGKVNLPESLKKLQNAGFTGTLHFSAPQMGGVILYDAGRILSAACKAGSDLQCNGDAVANLFEHSLAGGAVLNIYRLSPRLARNIHSILNAPARYQDQDVKLIDFRVLLARLKEEGFTGGIHVYTDEKAALIFYRDGLPTGFFNDGSADIEETVDLSLSVARLPGARIKILNASSTEGELPDPLNSMDLTNVWAMARCRVVSRMKLRQQDLARQQHTRQVEHKHKVLSFVKGVAAHHLGKMGPALAEKEFEKALGTRGEVSKEVVEEFCIGIARTAKLVAGPSVVKAMLEEMKKGARALN
jgi:hypothetical protein